MCYGWKSGKRQSCDRVSDDELGQESCSANISLIEHFNASLNRVCYRLTAVNHRWHMADGMSESLPPEALFPAWLTKLPKECWGILHSGNVFLLIPTTQLFENHSRLGSLTFSAPKSLCQNYLFLFSLDHFPTYLAGKLIATTRRTTLWLQQLKSEMDLPKESKLQQTSVCRGECRVKPWNVYHVWEPGVVNPVYTPPASQSEFTDFSARACPRALPRGLRHG